MGANNGNKQRQMRQKELKMQQLQRNRRTEQWTKRKGGGGRSGRMLE